MYSDAPEPTGFEDSAGYEGETTGIEATDEDDQVIVPAAPMSVLGYNHRGPVAVPKYKQLENRRMTIPILITCGVLFLIAPVFGKIADEESPLSLLMQPLWMVLILIVVGLGMLGLGIMTMLQVKAVLEEQKNQPS